MKESPHRHKYFLLHLSISSKPPWLTSTLQRWRWVQIKSTRMSRRQLSLLQSWLERESFNFPSLGRRGSSLWTLLHKPLGSLLVRWKLPIVPLRPLLVQFLQIIWGLLVGERVLLLLLPSLLCSSMTLLLWRSKPCPSSERRTSMIMTSTSQPPLRSLGYMTSPR